MTMVQYSTHWFDRIPSSLFEWGDFFLALRTEIGTLISSGHLGHATLSLSEQHCSECWETLGGGPLFQLSFTFVVTSTNVSWSAETLGADSFTVNQDLSWSYDVDDMGTIGELSDEFRSWVEHQDNLSGRVAVFAIAIAKNWLINPPSGHSEMCLEARGPWVD